MSDGTVISCRLESGNRRILHGESQKSRKGTPRACSAIIASFKRLRAIIDRCSDIWISSKIGYAAISFKEFRMAPRAERMAFGKFFRVGNGANELQPYFPSVFEFTSVEHIETGDIY